MANNFSNLGFKIESAEQFQELATKAACRSTPVPTFIGGAYLHFATPEGVELWNQVSPEKEQVIFNV